MNNRDIIVIGASLGGVEALQQLVAGFPKDFGASIFVVLHVGSQAPSLLPQILSRSGPLNAVHPEDRDPIERGRIYVAPPDNHMILERGLIRVMRGPRENRHRPAIDVLFRSAAWDCGDRVVGVILTGSLDDGAAGMLAVKNRGGIAIVQAPENAFCPDMPKSVLRILQPDHILPLNEIASKLEKLVGTQVETPVSSLSSTTRQETLISELNMNAIQEDSRPGKPSTFACPDCHGVLWEIEDSGDLTRYRCRVGHGYSSTTLADAHSEHLENCMWAALRALEESASLARKMAERSRQKGRHASAARFEEHARSKERQASMMRTVLLENEKLMSDLSSATSRLNIA